MLRLDIERITISNGHHVERESLEDQRARGGGQVKRKWRKTVMTGTTTPELWITEYLAVAVYARKERNAYIVKRIKNYFNYPYPWQEELIAFVIENNIGTCI